MGVLKGVWGKDGRRVKRGVKLKKIVEAVTEEERLHVRRLGPPRVLPIGDDPYGNVMDDRIRYHYEHGWHRQMPPHQCHA